MDFFEQRFDGSALCLRDGTGTGLLLAGGGSRIRVVRVEMRLRCCCHILSLLFCSYVLRWGGEDLKRWVEDDDGGGNGIKNAG